MGKYSWTFLKKNIRDGISCIVFERSPTIKLAHQKHIENSRNIYVNPGDHIRIEYMNWRPFQNSEGKIMAVSNKTSLQTVIITNIFPYNLRKGIHHKNIFSVVPLTADEINTKIKDYLGNQNKDFLWFVNTPENQSIPDLWHCHFFHH
jgi:hypothetical protein